MLSWELREKQLIYSIGYIPSCAAVRMRRRRNLPWSIFSWARRLFAIDIIDIIDTSVVVTRSNGCVKVALICENIRNKASWVLSRSHSIQLACVRMGMVLLSCSSVSTSRLSLVPLDKRLKALWWPFNYSFSQVKRWGLMHKIGELP
jgi:hypothetical protein